MSHKVIHFTKNESDTINIHGVNVNKDEKNIHNTYKGVLKVMKIIREIDMLGRVVIPKDLREKLNLNLHDKVEIHFNQNRLILQKSQKSCFLCNSLEDLKEYSNKHICKECIDNINKL